MKRTFSRLPSGLHHAIGLVASLGAGACSARNSSESGPSAPSSAQASGSERDAQPDGATGLAAGSSADRPPGIDPTHPRLLRVNGQPYEMTGVCWNPVGVGGSHPEDLDYPGFAEQDIALMAELGLNTVRTYEPLLDRSVLDRLLEAGIRVVNSIYPWGGDDPSVVSGRVKAVADHPAILMWALGNEWNYNGLYAGLSHSEALDRINRAAALVRLEDSLHPIATIYGELPSPETIAAMPDIDVWGINSYRGLSFGDLFDRWAERSEAPMFLAEYGADAFNSVDNRYDPESHSLAVTSLTRELLEHSSARSAEGVTIGGALFEWADEWWKVAEGSPSAQDTGGIAPGTGPYPDATFNEEWWGLVEIDRTPRPAFDALKALLQHKPSRSGASQWQNSTR